MPEVAETDASPYSLMDDPLYLLPTDQPSLKLSSFLFDGTNFNKWQREVMQALLSKNKDGFVTGVCAPPAKTDKRYNQWVRCDLLVLRWILNSLDSSLRDNLEYANSSKYLWLEILERYGQLNILELFELKKTLNNFKQENMSLIEYYSKLKGSWETVDSMDPLPSCTCGVMDKCSCGLFKRLIDRETQTKLLQLLMGLNSGYEQSQTTLLSMDPLPPINKALGILQKVERQKIMNDNTNDVLVGVANYSSKTKFNDDKSKKSGSVSTGKSCTHCKKAGHDITECFLLQTCTFCNVKGHIKPHCYQFKAQKAKQAKGKGDNQGHTKSANNALLENNQDWEYEAINPLEYAAPAPNTSTGISSAGSNSATAQQGPDFMNSIVESVMQKVLKALTDKPPAGPEKQSSCNSAGLYH